MPKADATADLDWNHLENKLGRICGGKYLQELAEEDDSPIARERPLTRVDADVPLTYTHMVPQDGKEFMVLDFRPGDHENPYNWNKARKILISTELCLLTLFIGLATTVYSSLQASTCTEEDSKLKNGCGSTPGASKEKYNLGLFAFNQTCAIAPLFLAPFCELAGRRVVYTGGYLGFCLCFIGLALGKNIATLLVMRTFLGFFGCVGTILVGGTFDDLYVPHERAWPMATWSWIAIFGTVSAPIYAGFVDQNPHLRWRWTEGIQGLANIPLLILVLFTLTETRGGVTLQKRAKTLRKDTGDDRWVAREDLEAPTIKEMLHSSTVKAAKMLVTEPVVFFFGFWISFTWFLTFLFLSVIPITYGPSDPKTTYVGHGWSEGLQGLPYIGLAVGCTLALFVNGFQIDKYNQLVKKMGQGNVPPEGRLYGCLFGGIFLPIGLFIYSFTLYKKVHWIGPCIGLGCIGFGIFFIFESCYSYTADCYGDSAGSATAAQSFMRNTLGAVSPLFASYMFINMGEQYAGLLLSLVGLILTSIVYILFMYGSTIRARSKLAIVYPKLGEEVHEKNVSSEDTSQISEGEAEASQRKNSLEDRIVV